MDGVDFEPEESVKISTFFNPMYRPTKSTEEGETESLVDPTPRERAVETDVDGVDSEPEESEWEAYCRPRQAVRAKVTKKRYRIYDCDRQHITDAYFCPSEIKNLSGFTIVDLSQHLERNIHECRIRSKFSVNFK